MFRDYFLDVFTGICSLQTKSSKIRIMESIVCSICNVPVFIVEDKIPFKNKKGFIVVKSRECTNCGWNKTISIGEEE